MSIRCTRLDIYRTAIPMRSFEHAAASRSVAEAIIVRAEFSDGLAGWGETLPRRYVTGETLESVPADIEQVIWPVLAGRSWSDPSALCGAIPVSAGGRCINAAACAVELACVDWLIRSGRAGEIGLAPGPRRAAPAVRISGVLGSADPARTARRLGLMRWFGLRDFKLKLGFGEEIDAENLRVVVRRIGRAVAAGRCTLRVDVNGGWDLDTAPQRIAELKALGVCAVEQPVSCPAGRLVDLARHCELPLMADESLITDADAGELLAEPRKVWWNVRISKNGGLLRAMSLIARAAEAGAVVLNGCMVGESGVLSGAQRRLLAWAGPRVRWAEGNYGRFLLSDDLTRPSPRMGFAGRLRPIRTAGLVPAVEPAKLRRYGRRVAALRA
ncbi:MAG: hypothetical protein J7M21_03630 [Planctomycetes bacterium]|nr:hypothetical protein [Planctomycetota bacterium]